MGLWRGMRDENVCLGRDGARPRVMVRWVGESVFRTEGNEGWYLRSAVDGELARTRGHQ